MMSGRRRLAWFAAVTVVLAAVAAIAPAPDRAPLSLVIAVLGGCASALFVQTHNYPGRMSIHLVPFAVAAAVVVAGKLALLTPDPLSPRGSAHV